MIEMRTPLARRRDLLGLAAAVRVQHPIRARRDFHFGGLSVLVESNSVALVDALVAYFRPFLRDWTQAVGEPRTGLVVTALEAETPRFNLSYRDWPRDPGKLYLKERIADLAGGRVVQKVRTGMHFLVGGSMRVAVGPCLANANQVINFIVTQYIDHYLRQGWQLCHAAAVSTGGRGLALAGIAGAGKSTLALHLLGKGLAFLSNDRVLVRAGSEGVRQAGVPKLPRINPGTAMHQQELHGVLPAARRAELQKLESNALWTLEEKYDVDLDLAFGPGRLARTSALAGLVLLTWRRDESGPPQLRRAELDSRPDLLTAVAKNPGPFHLGSRGAFVAPMATHHLQHLSRVPLFEITGGVDFERACSMCLEILERAEPAA